MLIWIISARKNIDFNRLIHWSAQRADISAQLIEKITTRYPRLPDGAMVLVQLPDINPAEAKLALADQNALQVIYNDPTMTTFFGNRDEFFKRHRIGDQQIFVVD